MESVDLFHILPFKNSCGDYRKTSILGGSASVLRSVQPNAELAGAGLGDDRLHLQEVVRGLRGAPLGSGRGLVGLGAPAFSSRVSRFRLLGPWIDESSTIFRLGAV